MYNLRYHVASLVGVFLALALGLILGGLVVQRGTVGRQQATLVDSLRTEFKTLRTDNKQLTDDNALLTLFSKDMSDAWTVDRLVGRNVVVITNAGRASGLKNATDALVQSGATPIVISVAKKDLGLQEAAVRSAISSDTTEFSDKLVASVATSLVAEWTTPAPTRPLTEALIDAGVITVDSFDQGMVAAGLVNIAMLDGAPDKGALAVTKAFSVGGSPAVAAESINRKTGVAAAGASADVSAMDSLGSPVGAYTLVALLSGAEGGFYGFGADAVAQYPPPVTK